VNESEQHSARRKLIEDALAILRDNYIFPDRAEAAAVAIEARLAAAEYDDLDEETLGARVTERLFTVCADQHLRLRVRLVEMHDAMTPEEELIAWNEAQRLSNYRIARAERLDGNVGYLDLRGITSPDIGWRAIAAAMELVTHTDALLIDLRKNRGGDPDGVQLWNSYLFPDSDVHLNSIYHAATKQARQYWTLAYVTGQRYLKPVYLLISAFTFSAGEEFAYNLQAQGRASLIGEVTRGGAHPTQSFRLSTTMEITVPYARSINPVTGTNWEGTGVVPDVAVPAAEAFDLAYRKALEHVAATSTSPTMVAEAKEALAGLS
jgi:C-terminal processing protease CtpA/Prc